MACYGIKLRLQSLQKQADQFSIFPGALARTSHPVNDHLKSRRLNAGVRLKTSAIIDADSDIATKLGFFARFLCF
jgi:hypothetical protein